MIHTVQQPAYISVFEWLTIYQRFLVAANETTNVWQHCLQICLKELQNENDLQDGVGLIT